MHNPNYSHLKAEFDVLKKMEKTNRHIYQQRGELHEERKISLFEQQKTVEDLKSATEILAELLDKPMVDLPKETKEEHQMSIDIYHPERGTGSHINIFIIGCSDLNYYN